MLATSKVRLYLLLGLLTILVGLFPYIEEYIPSGIPVSGDGYQAIIIGIGILMVLIWKIKLG